MKEIELPAFSDDRLVNRVARRCLTIGAIVGAALTWGLMPTGKMRPQVISIKYEVLGHQFLCVATDGRGVVQSNWLSEDEMCTRHDD